MKKSQEVVYDNVSAGWCNKAEEILGRDSKWKNYFFLFEPGKQSYLVGQQKKTGNECLIFSIARTWTWQWGQDISSIKKKKSNADTGLEIHQETHLETHYSMCHHGTGSYEWPWKCLSSLTSKSSCKFSTAFYCWCCPHKCCLQTLFWAEFPRRKS